MAIIYKDSAGQEITVYEERPWPIRNIRKNRSFEFSISYFPGMSDPVEIMQYKGKRHYKLNIPKNKNRGISAKFLYQET